MECQKCGDAIEAGEERDFHGRILCEDCYMDALSPARTCDPWAVHTAKSLIQEKGGEPEINPLQARILGFLRESGGAELKEIAERLQVKPSILEREMAALRHMEKIRGALKDGRRIILLW